MEKYKKDHVKLPESVKDFGLIPEMDEAPIIKNQTVQIISYISISV